MSKNKIYYKSEVLKNKWKDEFMASHDNCIVWDGIINYDEWFKNNLKIMFLLKEAFSKNNETEWNIAEAINEDNGIFYVGNQANQAMQNRVAEWAYAVDEGINDNSITKEEALNKHREKPRKSMLKAAWVNIKKIDGIQYSNSTDLTTFVKRNNKLLKEQIGLINPNIILCGGTFNLAKKELFENSFSKIKGTEYCYDWNGKLLIKFRHPSRAAVSTMFDINNDIQKIARKHKYIS